MPRVLALLLGCSSSLACVPPSGTYTPFAKGESATSSSSSSDEQGRNDWQAVGDLVRGKASLSAAAMGCDEHQVEVVDSAGSQWTARCIDETYHCERARDGKVSCTRDAAEKALDDKRDTDRIVDAIEAKNGENSGELRDAPTGALGFTFGASVEESQTSCTGASLGWTASGRAFVCDGSPVSLGLPGQVRLNFCDGKLCRIIAMAKPSSLSDAGYRQGVERFSAALSRKYGAPTKQVSKMPNWCRHELLKCLQRKEASIEERWEWPNGSRIRLTVQQGQQEPSIVIVYHRDPSAAALEEAL